MNFTVYTKEGCPYCSSILQILVGKDLTFTEYRLDVNFTKEEFYNEFGKGTTFPQVTMDGKKLGGCTESVKYLRGERII